MSRLPARADDHALARPALAGRETHTTRSREDAPPPPPGPSRPALAGREPPPGAGAGLGGLPGPATIWVKALAHPLRVRILQHLLAHETTAASELADRWQLDLSLLSYHVRQLHQLGLIELRTRTQHRGAYKHHYRLRDPAAVQSALWRLGAPPPQPPTAHTQQAESRAARTSKAAIAKLRERRQELGLSQTMLARRAGITIDHLGRIERGTSDPRTTTLLTLADALEIPYHHLLTPPPDQTP